MKTTTFIDIAGRVSLSTDTFHRVTGAAVVIASDKVDIVRAELPDVGKWAAADFSQAERMVEFLIRHAAAVGVMSIDKATPEWEAYAVDAGRVERRIQKQDGRSAKFVRAPTFLRLNLMTGSAAIAFAHALRVSGLLDRARDFGKPLKLENQLVFDNDIQGAENEQSLRNALNQPMSASGQQFGFELDRPFSIKTEQDEPLLLLADFAAGIVHASFLPEADEHLPLEQAQARELRDRLQRAGLLALYDAPFDVAAADVYGDLADED